MHTYEETTLPLEQLLLDPNNFRFHGEKGRPKVAERRYADVKVQESAKQRLTRDGIAELKQSILSNGFLPVERIVVKEHSPSSNDDTLLYVVLEGNRRVATLKSIQQDDDTGVEVPAGVLDSLNAIPVVLLRTDDESAYLSIMGMRHVGGIKEWGGYQSAKLVSELKSEHDLSTQDVASRLGLSAQEVNRRYRAFQALEQMRTSEEYGENVNSDLYPLFHEALSAPRLRTWLGWSDDQNMFVNEDERNIFYSLLSPFSDGAVTRTAKITSYSQVRELKSVLDHTEAFESLLDRTKSFSDAVALVKATEATRDWPAKVRAASNSLNHMGLLESKKLNAANIVLLKEMKTLVDSLIEANEPTT